MCKNIFISQMYSLIATSDRDNASNALTLLKNLQVDLGPCRIVRGCIHVPHFFIVLFYPGGFRRLHSCNLDVNIM